MKQITHVWLLILIPCVFFSCQNIKDMKINHDSNQILPVQETENIKFIKSWKRWDKTEALRLYNYSLKEIEEINGIPCKSRFTLDSLGNLYGFILGEDFILNGSMLPAGSGYETRLGRNAQKTGYMIYLSKSYDIQGYHVRNKAGMENYKVDFYNNGSLRDFKIYEDLEIDGIPCKGGKKSGISLYPDGKLWICYLSKDIEIDGKRFVKGAQILIDTSGKIFKYSLDLHLEIMRELNIY